MPPVSQSMTTADPDSKAEPAPGIILQTCINRRNFTALPGTLLACRKITHQLAACRYFGALGTWLAPQNRFLRLFKPGLADLEARGDEKRIAIVLVILGGCRTHIANKMADAGAFGIRNA